MLLAFISVVLLLLMAALPHYSFNLILDAIILNVIAYMIEIKTEKGLI